MVADILGAMSEEIEQQVTSHEDVISQAKKRFKDVDDAESRIRKEAIEDLKFRTGDQWPDDVKTQRNLDGRPCITINRLPQFIRQITNDQRQNRPSIKVYPVDDKADIETAKVLQGLIKHIEYNSNADIAYDTSFEMAVTTGRGFFRIITDYCTPMSFDQEILIKMIENPLTVYFDTFSIEPDGSDANYCLIVEDMSRAEFKKQFPDAEISGLDDWSSLGASSQGWITQDSCRIAEYFVKEYKSKKLALLSNGDVIEKTWGADEIPDFGFDDEAETRPTTVKSVRESMIPMIKWYKINGNEVLEETEWPGAWIPVIPVYGDKFNIDGQKILEGIVRHAKDPQRMYNYWSSNETEVIALAPRAPFIGVAGQFEGFEDKWRDANKRNFPFLEYNPTSVAGTPAPPPTRNQWEPPVSAITQAKAFAADDLKATTGVYDQALGAGTNDQSGIAISRRTTQSQLSNFHFIDNFSRALRHAGRVVINLIPSIYDTPRAQRILKEDGTSDLVSLNKIFNAPDGKQMIHDLSVGEYDVVVETGPSFATKRMEAAASIEKVIKAYPQLMTVASDILIGDMDWPGASELAARLKKTIPSNLLDDPKNPNPVPPQAQAQMQQMQSMIQSLSQSLTTANQIIENKKLELASKERIELAKLNVNMETTLLKEGSSHAQFTLEQQIAMLNQRQAMLQQQQPLNPESSGPQAAMPMGQNKPTGGQSPGQPMGV
jgi:hypothetical protein